MKTEEQVILQLRAGNTLLLEALMLMVQQYFFGEEFLSHSNMVCEEQAIKALILAGVAEKDPERGYRLLWDKLEARKAVEQAKEKP
jgi:hypothetical protein